MTERANSEPHFASVFVDTGGPAARRPFDYAVPAELVGSIRPGSLVIVPLGRRFVRGVVAELTDRPGVPDTKPVKGLYPHAGLLDGFAPEIARFVASRYACTPAEAYRAVMPKAIGGRPVRTWTVAEAPEPPPGTLSPELDRIYQAVRAKSGAGLAQIRSLTGIDRQHVIRAVRELEKAGLLVPGSVFSMPPVRPPVPVYAIDEVAAAAELPAIARRAPRQAELLRELLARDGAVAQDELPPGPGPRRALQALEARGLVVRTGWRAAAPGEDPVPGMSAPGEPLELTPAQAAAVDAVAQAVAGQSPREFLLHGVTGSGKTEVYLQAIAGALALGRQALVLVPEIALTPQAVTRFAARFPGAVAVLHSRLPAGERSRAWRDLATGRARICIGPRSAVFAPLPDLGLIVVDEEHEQTYKQEEVPRYDAREVARERSRLARAPLVFGSATPSLELYHRAEQAGRSPDAGRPVLLELPRRIDGRPLPEVVLVDMREELAFGNRLLLSRRLREEIAARLDRSEQVLLFLNRRGLSTFVLCRDCGFVARCPECDVALVYHHQDGALRCHYCGYRTRPPQVCPKCSSRRIRYFGAGTERVEAQVSDLFPQANTARLDLDVAVRRGAAGRVLGAFARGEIDILVGTQMIGKGMDIPAVTLVGVVAADTALNLPDFRAAERTFTLVTQVAGRAGRGDVPGLVLVQSYCPEHYSLRHAARHDYRTFFAEELESRRELGYPPFSHLAVLRVSAPSEQQAASAAAEVFAELKRQCGPARAAAEKVAGDRSGGGRERGENGAAVRLLGSAPAPLARLQGRYRWNIVLSSTDPLRLAGATGRAIDAVYPRLPAGVRVAADVDPQDML